MDFQLMFFTMVASQATGLVAATQLMIEPENTWFSWPAVVATVTVAIISTRLVVRYLERADAERAALRQDIDDLREALGLPRRGPKP